MSRFLTEIMHDALQETSPQLYATVAELVRRGEPKRRIMAAVDGAARAAGSDGTTGGLVAAAIDHLRTRRGR